MSGLTLGLSFWGGRMSAEAFRDTLLTVSPEMLLIADLNQTIDTGNGEAGDQLSGWGDCTTNNHDASQSTDSSQLTLTSANSAINSRASLNGDGSADYMTLAAGGGWSASTDHTFVAVINPTATDSGRRYLLDAQTGRLIILPRYGPTGNVAIYDAVDWREASAATTGWQILEWKLDAGATTVTMYRDGASLGTDTYTPRAFGGATVNLFSAYIGAPTFCVEGDIATVFYIDSLLSAPDRATVYAAIGTYYGMGYSL